MPELADPKLRPVPPRDPPTSVAPCEHAYAELGAISNFSFLRGASHPDELVYTAAELGYRAIGIADHNTLAGVVRAHVAAKQCGLKLLVGARLTLSASEREDEAQWEGEAPAEPMRMRDSEASVVAHPHVERSAPHGSAGASPSLGDSPSRGDSHAHHNSTLDVIVYPQDRPAYARLCRLLTLGKSRVGKGEFLLTVDEFCAQAEGMHIIFDLRFPICDWDLISRFQSQIANRKSQIHLGVSLHYDADNAMHLDRAIDASRQLGIPLVAHNDVHYHDPGRRMLQDVLTCVRHGTTVREAGFKLHRNAERYLKSPAQMHRLFADHPQAIERALHIARSCTFSLEELRYEYPREVVPDGVTPIQHLRDLTERGAIERYPEGIPAKVRAQVDHEYKLIEQLRYEAYFLTVHDLVRFARGRDILCQGRGSAANSAVCYCLGVTSVDPARTDLLFERFISAARNEPPDIDVDFEHERREEVIQYVYEKYGRDRAGMTAVVISYRGRSAVRDVGKAMGLSLDQVDQMAKRLDWWHRGVLTEQQVIDAGLDPRDATVRAVLALCEDLLGFPRHLGQHVGGMVMTHTPLCEMVPIENARMADRTVIEWDKDDIEAVGMLKVDCLALGMLTMINRAFKLLERWKGETERRVGMCLNKETERRRDEETKELADEREDVSRLGGLAIGDDSVEVDLSSNSRDARGRAIRPDITDASIVSFCTVKHCRGLRAAESGGTSEISSDGEGISQRTEHPVSVGVRNGDAEAKLEAPRSDRRDGPCVAGTHSQLGTKERLAPHLTSSLHLSVSPSLCLPKRPLQLHTIPPDDPAVYDMICRADTVGVFQIESRAQMSMLPRLKPRTYYDLVIEVAIVRPGPIQGDMVHPYLRRRNGEEPVSYPSEALRQVLQKTLGVPLFQEQAMKVAMVAAGFTADEADQLRRAMAAWRKNGALEKFYEKIITGMIRNGYDRDFAERTFNQIRGFGEYGFPESHAASFAHLVYASAYLKCHHPAVFCAALLNSQPMGFYAPAQIVRDAIDHGVVVRQPDVNFSEWDCSLEKEEVGGSKAEGQSSQPSSFRPPPSALRLLPSPTVRLGLRMIKGFREEFATIITAARDRVGGRFDSVDQFHRATRLPRHVIQRLAEADAFASIDVTRRTALWEALELEDEERPVLEKAERDEETKGRRDGVEDGREEVKGDAFTSSLRLSVSPSLLPPMSLGREVLTDYATVGLSLKAHPMSLVRDVLDRQRILRAADATARDEGARVSVCGLVLVRQRPGTASGVVFITLEDESGIVNLIVRPHLYEKYRDAARHAAILQCDGTIERQGLVVHVMARKFYDRSDLLGGVEFASRDFH